MNPFELIASLLAPHTCINCSREGLMLCVVCSKRLLYNDAYCYRCSSNKAHNGICSQCARTSPFTMVFTGTEYSGQARDAIHHLKFNRAKAMADDIASWMATSCPPLPTNTIVSHIPTVNQRIRVRGYDQACLIARSFARKRGLQYKKLLVRQNTSRQVGASRQERFSQLSGAFALKRTVNVPVLLIDDVLTTGASLEAAATLFDVDLYGAVFAHQPTKSRSPSNTKSDSKLIQ